MPVTPKVTRSLQNAPLPQIIERLGSAIAEAQAALDTNSVSVAEQMAAADLEVGGERHNLLSLGFMPTFYSFTEATVEAKLSFSMAESIERSISVGGEVGGVAGPVMFGASIDVSYARKFSVSAEGTSSIAARLVSLPPPEAFTALLRRHYEEAGS